MKDITPKHLRCGASLGSCPAVYELEGELADPTKVIVVGKRVFPNGGYPQLRGKIGEHEVAIVIDRALLANVLK